MRAKAAVRAIVAHQSCPRVPSEQSSFSFALHATQNLLEASRYDSLISKLGQVSNKSESGGLVATSLGLARAFEIVTEIRDRELLRAPKTVWITDFCGSRRAIFRNNTLRDRVRDWLLFCCVLCVFFSLPRILGKSVSQPRTINCTSSSATTKRRHSKRSCEEGSRKR